MATQIILYRLNDAPHRGLATSGIFIIKAFLAVPHWIIVGALQSLAFTAAYVGYWLVALTGNYPSGLQTFVVWWLRWDARIIGWYTGVNDVYPPFEPEPEKYEAYLPDLDLAHNESPSKGWAVMGIFLLKFVVALPHLFVLALLWFATMIGSWFGFIAAAFTGRLPRGIQDLAMGTTQWTARVMAWIGGLTDEYPPFELSVTPLPAGGD
jgi:hypothetical protein